MSQRRFPGSGSWPAHQLLLAALLLGAFAPVQLLAQQIPDTTFLPTIDNPLFSEGTGPLLVIDEAHNNVHRLATGYAPFAELARREGFRVQALTDTLHDYGLIGVDVLVIANALASEDIGHWHRPNHPAFHATEIAAVQRFVHRGGTLLLIADHMPLPAAARDLAASFGFLFADGFAHREGFGVRLPFRRGAGIDTSHTLAGAAAAYARVDSVIAFAGQAFVGPTRAKPLLILGENSRMMLPDSAWDIDADTPWVDAEGWWVAATLDLGQGRVAVFGEAAMLTAQLAGRQQLPVGMNSPDAPGNLPLARNLLRWLAGP